MGEASPKSLRGGAMDDVIFAGTSTRPARDFAEVSLHAEGLENTGEAEVVRRIDRGAGSGYRLNGSDVRAKDIALLFADAATGAHSPALVSQGRISAIIAARPTERRLMLEEAAGISGLHVRRKDAEQKLRATETNLQKLDEVLAEMEARIASLRRQAKAAERYRKLSDDIRIAEARQTFAKWRTAAASAEAAKAEAKQAETAVSDASAQQRAIAAYQTQAIESLSSARQAALVARDARSEAAHQLNALKSEHDNLTRRMADLKAQTERLTADRTREGALANDAAEALASLAQESKALDAQIVSAEASLPQHTHRLAEAEAHGRDCEVSLAQGLADQAHEQAEVRVADANLLIATQKCARLAADIEKLNMQLTQLGDDQAAQHAQADALAQKTAAQAIIQTATQEVEQAEHDRNTAAVARELADANVGTFSATLAVLEGEANALGKALETTKSGDRALDHVQPEPGYERALAAALGEDLEAAIIGPAKRLWKGRAESLNAAPLPTGTSALINHVKAPPQLTLRLQNVAVVETDEGQALSIGQRLVTLDGQLRRWDGFVAAEQGAAAGERLIRQNRLNALQTQITPAQDALAQAQADRAAHHAAVERARQMGDAARAKRSAAEQALRTAERAEDQAQATLERSAARRQQLHEQRAQAQQEHQLAQGELEGAKSARAAVPDGRATQALVAARTTAAEGARRTIAELRAESLSQQRTLHELRERLQSSKAQIKNWQSRAGDAAKRIDEMTKRAQTAEQELARIANEPDALAEKIRAIETGAAQRNELVHASQAAEQAAEVAVRDYETRMATNGEAMASAREARARAQARAEHEDAKRIEMTRISGERFACPPPLLPSRLGFEEADIATDNEEVAQHEKLVLERERLGPVNLIAERELAEIDAARTTTITERDELHEAVNRLRGSIGSLNREGRQRLLAAFTTVDQHFQRLFGRLFNGGVARLQLVDSDDPLEAGLEIFAQPPGKKLTNLSLLSGGEQALTAVALIFGLFLTNPAPICVLDEVDAPLDDANIERFCDLLDTMIGETSTRYLIVTHNAVTMSRMHRLFGVTMVEQGVSRLVSVDLSAAERLVT